MTNGKQRMEWDDGTMRYMTLPNSKKWQTDKFLEMVEAHIWQIIMDDCDACRVPCIKNHLRDSTLYLYEVDPQ